MKTIKSLHIQWDSNEKPSHRLLFPPRLTYRWGGRIQSVTLTTERLRLPEGDYVCPQVPSVGFERKGSLRELHTNFETGDRDRARDAFIRFANAFEDPIVLAHVSFRDFKPNHRVGGLVFPGHIVWDSFCGLALELGLHLWLCGPVRDATARRQLGTLVARTFLQRGLRDEDQS